MPSDFVSTYQIYWNSDLKLPNFNPLKHFTPYKKIKVKLNLILKFKGSL